MKTAEDQTADTRPEIFMKRIDLSLDEPGIAAAGCGGESGSRLPQSRIRGWLLALGALFLAGTASAQWQDTTLSLKGGFNAIYLHGDASGVSPDDLFDSGAALNIEEVWRWNPNPNQAQFTTTPLLPLAGTPEWSVWIRGGSSNTLARLTGQSAYLVKCVGTTANTYSISLPLKPMVPGATWVRNGANLLGFPTNSTGGFPSFSNYFATFPAAIATNSKIFTYEGGPLSLGNPRQIFSVNAELVDRNKAYWFESEVVGNFYAPIQITLSQSGGLDFGRTGSIITARVLNRTSAVMTLNISPAASATRPAGEEDIAGPVAVTRRTFDPGTATFIETLISTAYTEVVPPNGSIELSFGIDRGAMTGPVNAFFASMLRFTDSTNRFDITLPVTARKASLAGLWVGDALVSRVESKPDGDAVTDTARSFPLRFIVHVSDAGSVTVMSHVYLGRLAAPPNEFGLALSEIDLLPEDKASAMKITAAHLPLDTTWPGGGSFGPGASFSRTIEIPFDDPTNPFVHQYHPDHNNKSPGGVKLVAGQESYDIERNIQFQFDSAAPPGVTGWGSSIITGSYQEAIQGLHNDSVGVGTGDGLQIEGTFELQRISEIGEIFVSLIGTD